MSPTARRRRLSKAGVWSLAVSAVVVAAVVTIGATVLRDPPGSGNGGAEPAASGDVASEHARNPGPVASRRVRVAATSQFDLARSAPLRLRLRPPQADNLTVVATLNRRGKGTRLAAPLDVGRHREHLTIRPRAHARRLLRRCKSYRLDVEIRSGGRVRARRQKRLPAQPPACGRYFAADSVWNAPIRRRAPVDAKSPALVDELARQVRSNFDHHFYPTINTTKYSAPIYTVPARQRRTRVTLVGGRARYGGRVQAVLEDVPIPRDAEPAAGNDGHIVIWQPATDTMWELWKASKTDRGWVCSWGGRIEDASKSRGYFYDSSGINQGATATSLPLAGGLITLRDLHRGRIDHALAMAIPASRGGAWAFPAQRSDGNVRSTDAIPAGARFRLDPDVDIAALDLPQFTAMLARAAQRYGIYVRDTSPVVTLYAEDPTPTGSNPWSAAITPSSREVLRRFPWDKLQVMRMDLRGYGGKHIQE